MKYCAKCKSFEDKDVDLKKVVWGICNVCGKDTAVIICTEPEMDMPDFFKDIFGDGFNNTAGGKK